MHIKKLIKKIDKKLNVDRIIKSDSRSEIMLCIKNEQKFVLKITKDYNNYERQVDSVNTLKKLSSVNFRYCQFPTIKDSGFVDEKYFYILETHIDGVTLAEESNAISKTAESIEESFPLIINALSELNNLSDKSFGKLYHSTRINKQLTNEIKNTSVKWATDDIPHITKLLHIIFNNIYKSSLKRGSVYFDTTPINLIVSQGKIAFFDTDLSRSNYFKFYDYVEFYHRLYTRACSPDLAQKFLEMTVSNQRNKDRFYELIYPLLAYRAIGNYHEINRYLPKSKNFNKRIEYANQFIDHILKKGFIL